MSNVTLAIDDDLLAAARAYAQAHGTTLNALVRQALGTVVRPPADTSWRERLLAVSARSRPEKAWRWSREEIYAERLDRYGKGVSIARDADSLAATPPRPPVRKRRRSR